MRLEELKDSSTAQVLAQLGADVSKSTLADRFVQLGMPTKKSEEYRYADIESMASMELSVAHTDTVEIAIADKVIIVDGIVTTAPDGVTVEYRDTIEVDDGHFDPLYYLGHIATPRVITIDISSEQSIEIQHRYTRVDSLIAYRVALSVSANTHAQVYESFFGADAKGSVVMYGYDVTVSRDATLNMIKNQTISSGSYRMVSSHRFVVESSATLGIDTFDFGSASALQTMQIELGTRASVDANHLLYASGDAKRGTVSKILHIGEGSSSNQSAKNILGDRARGIFDALIKVEHSARYTKAHQNSKAILLETGAYMASRPQLEIYIDELEASHGSTTGQLDGKQLFYLQSRGISETEARKILIQAFANELIDAIDSEALREQLHRDFELVFYGAMHIECIESCHGCEDIVINEKVE